MDRLLYVGAYAVGALLGVGLLLVAVCCDAISPVMQERMLGKYAIRAPELMLRTNLIAFVGILCALELAERTVTVVVNAYAEVATLFVGVA